MNIYTKIIQIGKKERKLLSFAEDMTVYIENPKKSTKKSKFISASSNVTGYKINIQIPITFLYTNAVHVETNYLNYNYSKESATLRYYLMQSLKMQYLTKLLWDLCAENHKMVMKDIKDNLNKWKDIPYSWNGTLIIIRISILPKLIYRFNAIPIKISVSFLRKK